MMMSWNPPPAEIDGGAGEPAVVSGLGVDQPQARLGVELAWRWWRRWRTAVTSAAAAERCRRAAGCAKAGERGQEGGPRGGHDSDLAASLDGRRDNGIREIGIEARRLVDDRLRELGVCQNGGGDGVEQRLVALGRGVGQGELDFDGQRLLGMADTHRPEQEASECKRAHKARNIPFYRIPPRSLTR